uniref:Uncharacterized protein n=1 Tax=Panagrolaimus sp. ES5 TaxID=591445 RepID=A0AC34GPN1_9BILA
MNKTVLMMVLCTTFVELIPLIGAQTFSMLTGLQLQNLIGPYGFTASTINISLSSGIYYATFKKNVEKIIRAKVSAMAKTSVVTKIL